VKNREAIRLALIGCLSFGAACGGTTTPPPQPPDQPEPPAPTTEDTVFTYDGKAMDGLVFPAQAIGLPGMWKIQPAKKTSLAAQRKIAAKPGAAVADLQVLAGLAWQESDKVDDKARAEKDPAKQAKLQEQVKALRTEARDALVKAYEAAGEGKADEITLKLRSVAELTLGNTDGAAKMYGEIIARFGKDGAINARTWLAQIDLQAGKLADAAKAVEGWTVKPDMDPMAAYVLGWVKFRQRDYATARAAIAVAAAGWKTATKKVVLNDVVLFNARAGAPFAEAEKTITDLAAGDIGNRYAMIYNLARGYDFAGYWDLAAAAIEFMLAGKAIDPLPPRDQVMLRAELAYHYYRLGDPAKTAELAKEAYNKLAGCGEDCAKDSKSILAGIMSYATTMHTNYANSLDERYYAPAKDLYDFYLGIETAPDLEVLRGYRARLEDTRNNADPKAGKHNKEEMLKQLELKYNAVKACYESVLQGEPTLAGDVTLKVIVKDDGSVEGSETEPAKGMQGLPAVSGCLEQRAKGWRFPGRTVKGNTTLVQKFQFSPSSK